ncbi:MAG: hypothetical protein GY861_07735 [bacterium]|nr:hypothetical protein [bacterium]
MDIAYAADLHGNRELYEKLFSFAMNKDAIILGGDIAPKSFHDINEIIEYQKKFFIEYLVPRIAEFGKDVYLMMGNDDLRINFEILEAAEQEGIFKLISNKAQKLRNFEIYGYPYVPVTPFRLKDWEKGDLKKEKVEGIQTIKRDDFSSIKDDFNEIKKKTDPKKTIYVIHTPPFNTKLDIIHDGTHVGSKTVRKFIEEEQPPLTLHGHIHESIEMSGFFCEKIGNTTIANPGSQHNPFTKEEATNLNVISFNTTKPSKVKLHRL